MVGAAVQYNELTRVNAFFSHRLILFLRNLNDFSFINLKLKTLIQIIKFIKTIILFINTTRYTVGKERLGVSHL